MLVDKHVEKVIRSLVGSKVVIYVDDYMDSRGIEKFTIDDYIYYLNEIEDGILEFKSLKYFNINNHFRLLFTYK